MRNLNSSSILKLNLSQTRPFSSFLAFSNNWLKLLRQRVRSQTGRLRLMIAPLKLSTHPLSSALLFAWLHSSKTNRTDLPVSFNCLWILSSPEVAMDSNWKIKLSTISTNRHREASSRRWGRRQSSNMALLANSISASVPGAAFASFWIRSKQGCQQCEMTQQIANSMISPV